MNHSLYFGNVALFHNDVLGLIFYLQIQAMGKQGTIVRILPDGDLQVACGILIHWIFNPECVELVDSCAFEDGEKARFKNLPTDQMKKIQERCLAWIPFMAEVLNIDGFNFTLIHLRMEQIRNLSMSTMVHDLTNA